MPKTRGRETESLDGLNPEQRAFLEELGLASQGAAEGMRNALDVLAAEYERPPDLFLNRWHEDRFLTLLLAEIGALPDEAGTGYFKFKGLLARRIDASCSMRYIALLTLYSARAMFLAERRGLDSVLSSVDASGFRYAHYLPDEGRILLAGFHPLFSALLDPDMKVAFHRFISRVAVTFGEGRAHAALCVTFDLLSGCGRGTSEVT